MDFPNPPSGSSREASWLRRLLAACVSNRIISGIGYKVRRTSSGTALEILPGGGGKGGGGLRYRGNFNQGQSYSVNDIVRQKDARFSLGTFICVRDNPISSTTGLCIAPSYPEPFDVTAGAVANTWEIFALGVKQYQGCKGGVTKQVYVNLNEI